MEDKNKNVENRENENNGEGTTIKTEEKGTLAKIGSALWKGVKFGWKFVAGGAITFIGMKLLNRDDDSDEEDPSEEGPTE